METTTLSQVEHGALADTDHGLELVPGAPAPTTPRKEGRVMLALGLLLTVYSVVYLFVLAVKFQA